VTGQVVGRPAATGRRRDEELGVEWPSRIV